MNDLDGYEITGEPVAIAFDALPDLARVLGVGQSQIDVVAEPFDGYVYAIRPAVPIFEAVRWPADEVDRRERDARVAAELEVGEQRVREGRR